MKFIYLDESGGRDLGDIFIMCGLVVDAYKLRKKTEEFDLKIQGILTKYPGDLSELKTSRFINGKGRWSQICPDERKKFLRQICQLAISNGGKIFGLGISFRNFDKTIENQLNQPFENNCWLASSMFICCLVQKKMQKVKNQKGLTVFIMDNNMRQMPNFSDGLYEKSPWYDGLYMESKFVQRKRKWVVRKHKNRFDQIINTAFAIKSNHSSLIQVADAISYVYRRYLELISSDEEWEGERSYYSDLFKILEPAREKLGVCPNTNCVKFYKQVVHAMWKI